MTDIEKILNAIRIRPGSRLVDIADRVDMEPDVVERMLTGAITAGDVSRAMTVGPNGRESYEYRLKDSGSLKPLDQVIKQQVIPKIEEKAKTKVQIGLDAVIAAGEQGITDIKMREVMGVQNVRAYMAIPISHGKCHISGGVWRIGPIPARVVTNDPGALAAATKGAFQIPTIRTPKPAKVPEPVQQKQASPVVLHADTDKRIGGVTNVPNLTARIEVPGLDGGGDDEHDDGEALVKIPKQDEAPAPTVQDFHWKTTEGSQDMSNETGSDIPLEAEQPTPANTDDDNALVVTQPGKTETQGFACALWSDDGSLSLKRNSQIIAALSKDEVDAMLKYLAQCQLIIKHLK